MFVVIIAVLGIVCVKLYLDYTTLSSSYDELTKSFQSLQQEYESLRSAHQTLQSQYSDLQSHHVELENIYNQLKIDYELVSSAHQKLLDQYRDLTEAYNKLLDLSLKTNNSLAEVITTLHKYCCIPYAFERTLNLDEVKAVAQYVSSAKVYSNDPYASIQNIYKWIRDNVKYVHDVPLPIPMWVACDPKTRLCYYFGFTDLRNYVQTPRFTAEYGQGDCDDQAVLAYAMIKYYFIFIHGNEYDLFVADITMDDGRGHLAVFLPVQGGMLTIVDPAGSYLTSTFYGSITARQAYDELTRYSNYWSNYGGIKKIELYRVDVRTGVYSLVVSGDIASVAFYLGSS